jgi:hypothetical protein
VNQDERRADAFSSRRRRRPSHRRARAGRRTDPQKSDWGRHIASIPNIILVRWMDEDGVNVLGMSSEEWGKYIKRKLDDPDWRHLRVDR